MVELRLEGLIVQLSRNGQIRTVNLWMREYRNLFDRLREGFIDLLPDDAEHLRYNELNSFTFSYPEFPAPDHNVRASISIRCLRNVLRPEEADAASEQEAFIKATVAALNKAASNQKRRLSSAEPSS